MSDLFQPIDSSQEAAILAAENNRGKRGPDLTIRTNTQWFTLRTFFDDCQVPDHEDNVTEENVDKGRRRMVFSIDGVNVCRWCYIAGRP